MGAGTATIPRHPPKRSFAGVYLKGGLPLSGAFVGKASDLISTLAAEGRMGYQSPSFERILGYEADDLRGRSLFDLVHPDDREMAEDTWSELMEALGTSVQIGSVRSATRTARGRR